MIKLETPTHSPTIASIYVKENNPPLLDFKYLRASSNGKEITMNYFINAFKIFSMLCL